jgi:dynein heavy chain
MYTKEINDSLRNIRQQMDEPMNTLKEYVAYVKGLKLSQDTLIELETKKTKLEQMKQQLQKNRDRSDTTTNQVGLSDISRLTSAIDSINMELLERSNELQNATEKAKMKKGENVELLVKQIEEQKKKLEEYIAAAEAENLMNKDIPNKDAIEDLVKLNKNYDAVMKKINVLKEYEEILESDPVPIPQIAEYEKKFNKRDLLWRSRENFRNKHTQWYYEDFLKQDSEVIVKEVVGYVRQNQEMRMKMGRDERDEVLDAFSDEVNVVFDHQNLILALGNKSMKKRHWMKVFNLLHEKDPQVNNSNLELANLTFQKLIEDGIEDIRSDIDEISGTAQGENQIETTMQEIIDKWDTTIFTVV